MSISLLCISLTEIHGTSTGVNNNTQISASWYAKHTHTQRKMPQNTLTSFVDYTKCIQSSLFRSLNNYQHKVHLCKYIQNPQTHSNVEYYNV